MSGDQVVQRGAVARVEQVADLPTGVLAPVLFLIGAAGGVSMLAFDLARTSNHGHQAGVASGVANMGGFCFAVVAELGVGILLDTLAGHGVAAPTAHRLAFGVALVGTFRLVRLHAHAGALPRRAEALVA